MKKTVLIFVCLVLCLTGIFAYENNQKIYKTDCREYEVMRYLYIIQGKALPSTTGPWSAAELLIMAEKIKPETLSEAMLADYEWLLASLNEKGKVKTSAIDMTFSGSANIQMFYHTNTAGLSVTDKTGIAETAFQGWDSWAFKSLDHKPFLEMQWETWAVDKFYGYFELGLRNSEHAGSNFNNELGVTNFGSNILFMQNLQFDLGLLDGNFPSRAFVSFGDEHWSFELGRDRLNWGAGETGNLTISDNLLYHNMARFTTYSDKYKYTFLTSFFPHPVNYFQNSETGVGGDWNALKQYYDMPQRGLSMYMAHRLEGRFFKDRLNLTLTEGIIYMSENGDLDLQVLNPVAFFHNYYCAANSNSTLALEFDFAVMKGLNVYGQMIIDELSFPGLEGKPSATRNDYPECFGYLAGVRSAFELGGGLLQASLEGAYTMPYLYLRRGIDSDYVNGSGAKYGLDYVVALRQWSSSTGQISYDQYFLGYQYGGDAIVGNFNVNWSKDNKLNVGLNAFYMAHGTHDKWTVWTTVGGSEDPHFPADATAPTTTHENTENRRYSDSVKDARDAVCYTAVIGGNASYDFNPNFSAFVQGDLVIIKNYANLSTNPIQKDIQLVFGGSWNF